MSERNAHDHFADVRKMVDMGENKLLTATNESRIVALVSKMARNTHGD